MTAGGFEADGVITSPPKAGGCEALQSTDDVVDVVSFYDPSDVVDEGDASTSIYLPLYRSIDLGDADSERTGEIGEPWGVPS